MQRRFAARPVQLESRDGKQQVITGYASVYYEPGVDGSEYQIWDELVERIMPGCFDRCLREKQDVRALVNHDPNCLLGRTMAGTCRLKSDRVGLRYEIDPPDTQAGRDVVVSLGRGDMTGSSFTFLPTAITWREEGKITIREVTDVDLFDVGPVTYPAYGSTTAGLRALGSVDDVRQALEAWKSARAKGEQEKTAALAASLNQYLARARVVEISAQAS